MYLSTSLSFFLSESRECSGTHHARSWLTQGLPLSILQLRQKKKEDIDDYMENTVSVNEHLLNTYNRKD